MLCAKAAVVVGGSLEEVSTSVIGGSENLSGLSPIHPRLAATGSSLWAVLFPPVDTKDSFLLLVGMVCSSVCRSNWGQSDHRLRSTTSSSGAKETCRLLNPLTLSLFLSEFIPALSLELLFCSLAPETLVNTLHFTPQRTGYKMAGTKTPLPLATARNFQNLDQMGKKIVKNNFSWANESVYKFMMHIIL